MSLITGLKASQEEIDDLDIMFKKLDKNHDGTLSLAELKEGMKEVLGTVSAEQIDWNDFFDSVDINKDGVVDYQEFLAASLNRQKMLTETNVDSIFNVFDVDGDGHIDLNELKKVF
jgi:calcium-dependent protein kinase